MSIWTGIENEFNTIVNDARGIGEKLESLVGLQSKVAELKALEPALTTIVEDASKATADKVEAILAAVGKL